MKVQQVNIELIKYNPYRDTIINPIDDAQVAKLIGSYTKSGDFGVLPARKVGDNFEIAAGHHRLKAMTEMGFAQVDLKVGEMTDDEMVLLLVAENATQYGGKPASQADSCGAAIRRLSFWFFMSDDSDQFNAFAAVAGIGDTGGGYPPPVFFPRGHQGADNGFKTAKKELLENASVGARSIEKYLNEQLNRDIVQNTLASLNSSGHIERVISQAQEDAHAEQLAAEAIVRAEEEVEEAKRQAAEAAEVKQRIAAVKAAERAKVAAEKAQAQAEKAKEASAKADLAREARDRVNAERKAKEESRELEARRIAREMAMEREKEERIRRDQLRARREAEAEQARAAAEKRKLEAHIDPRVFSYLDNGAQAREFVTVVNRNPKVLGKDVFDQVKFLIETAAHARTLAPDHLAKDTSREDKTFLNRPMIVDQLHAVDKKLIAARKAVLEEREAAAIASSLERTVDADMEELFGALGRIDKAFRAVHGHLQQSRSAELVMRHPYGKNLRPAVKGLYDILPKIEELTGMQVLHSDKSPSTVDSDATIIDIN